MKKYWGWFIAAFLLLQVYLAGIGAAIELIVILLCLTGAACLFIMYVQYMDGNDV